MKRGIVLKISTNIMNIKNFDNNKFSENNIGIEIQAFPQHKLDSNLDDQINLWKKKLSRFRNPISLHGSSFDLNPGSTDSKVLEVTKYRYLQSIDIAKRVNARYVIFHSQVNPLLTIKRIRGMKLENQINFWKDLLDNEIPNDICILIENEYDDTYEDIKLIYDKVDKHNFGVCLDIGHVLAYSKVKLEDWISNLGQRIKYIHLHWNDGNEDTHDEPSNNELSILSELLGKYDLNPIITLEYYSEDIYEEVNRIREHINKDIGIDRII